MKINKNYPLKDTVKIDTIKKDFKRHHQSHFELNDTASGVNEFDFQLNKIDIQVDKPRKVYGRADEISARPYLETSKVNQNESPHYNPSHPLIKSLQKQIQLDFDLRHAKHMFAGNEEPFYDCS
jgi:hypothetical protein